MELPPFDSISKIWAPSLDDLRKFCDTNKYVRQQLHGDKFKTDNEENKENDEIVKIEQPENPIQVLINGDLPISCFLYYVVKKSEVSYLNDITKPKIHFMEEEALVLCGMLKREGFLGEERPDATDEQDCCITCATEKLEKDLMETAQREMEIIALARKYYSLPENESKYNICANHRPFQTKNCVPRGNGINNVNGVNSALPTHPGSSKTSMPGQYFNPQNESSMPDQNYLNLSNKNILHDQYINAQNGRITTPPNLTRVHYDSESFLNNLGINENAGAQPNHIETSQNIGPQFCPNAKFAQEQSFPYESNFINPQLPADYLFEPEIYNNYYNTNEPTDFSALFQKCILGHEYSQHNNLTNQPVSSTYFPNLNSQTTQSANLFQNRVPPNCPNYVVNRGVNHNSTNHFAETLNTRQNEINAAVNTITRDLQHQILLSGNRVGRKILGKRY